MNVGWQPRPVREINNTKLRNRDPTRVGGNANLAASRAHAAPRSRRNGLWLDLAAISSKICLTLRRVEQKRCGWLELLLQFVRLAADLQIPEHRPARENACTSWSLWIVAPLVTVDGLNSALQFVRRHNIAGVEVL